MIDFHEKRAGHGRQPKPLSEAERHELAAKAALAKMGARPVAQFFNTEVLYKPMTRGDYLDIRCNEEYGRRENTWYRRAWRWLTHQPLAGNPAKAMANAHAKTLANAEARMKAAMTDTPEAA